MATYDRLQQLIDLAKESSSEKRRDLLRQVTDIFLEQPDDYSEVEREHFADIMGRAARNVEREVRQDLAMRLAATDAAPQSVIVQLANDEIEVARPILQNSGVLGDKDLLAIIKKKGSEHQRAVAARKKVSTALSDALVEHGDNDVLKTLIQNQGAEIAHTTMAKVVMRAETDAGLHEPLLGRQDLPPDLMHDMFWFVSSTLRDQIVQMTADIDPDMVDRLLAESEQSFQEKMANRAPTKTEAQIFIEKKALLRQLNEALLVQLLREKRIPEVICGFAKLAEVDETTARRIIFDKSGEGLAIACKANKFDRSTFSTFVLLASPNGARSIDQTYELLALYDRVPVDIAQRTMRFWRVRRETLDQAAA